MTALDVVRRHCEVYSGQRARLMLDDPVNSLLSRDVELRVHGGPEEASGHGWDAVVQLFEQWYALWESYSRMRSRSTATSETQQS